MTDQIVIDAVVHPFNLGPDNELSQAANQVQSIYHHHRMWQPAGMGYALDEAEFVSDFSPEIVAEALFTESEVDIGILHSLPNLGFTKGPLTPIEPLARLRDAYPGRFLLYGSINSPILSEALRELESQVERFSIDGLKFYPVFYYDGKAQGWSFADEEFALPLIDAARALGLRNIAIHKALAIGPTALDSFRVTDVEVAAARFPDVNFQIVHAGMAFLEETCLLLHRFKNVYANLEVPWNYSATRPAVFESVLGELIYWGSVDQILYGDGCYLVHPKPGLDSFAAFDFDSVSARAHGYAPLTDEDKAKIIGGNAARIHGLDSAAMRRSSRGDRFDQAREDGLLAPWHSLVASGQGRG